MSILNAPHFHEEGAAFAKLESVLWPDGPVCPHCGNTERIYALEGVRSKPSKKNPEGVVRHGLKKCGACRKQFTVRVGTVFESSHIPLHKWLQIVFLICSSKKGISAHQLHRTVEVTYEAAWFAAHRVREAMRVGPLAPPMGGGHEVEIDETYIGTKDGAPKKAGGYGHKRTVITLVTRLGEARSFHVDKATIATVMPIVRENLSQEAVVATDESRIYDRLTDHVAAHGRVNHFRDEYVSPERSEWFRGDIHTNTAENYFSIFKRGMKGVYQHCGEKHLHRYLSEFDFRYSNRSKLGVEDVERSERALRGAKGKRLTYK